MVKSIETFGKTWKTIVSHLQEAAGNGDWPVQPDQIMAGDWKGEANLAPPAVLVYLTPGKTFDAQNIYSRVATLNVFPLVEGDTDITESTDVAIDLAWKVVAALHSLPFTVRFSDRDRVRLDTVHGNLVVTNVQAEIWYTHES